MPIADGRRDAHAAAAIFVGVVEQVFQDHAQSVAISQDMHGVDRRDLNRAAARGACAVRQQVADELRRIDALRAFARFARHGALIRENGLRQVLEAIALDLPELDQLRALRLGNAAEREALQQSFHAGHRRLELVAGELQQFFHVFALLLAALREHEQHHQAAGQHQREQRGLADHHDLAAFVTLRDFDFAFGHLLRRQSLLAREQRALEREVGVQLAAQQDGPPEHQ